MQVLDRTQPVLPMRPGLPERRTHDYRPHGTTSLFAALNVATGKVLAQCHRRHRAVEFVKFLRAIDKAVPTDQDIHVVLDNYGTHKTAMIHEWLARHPRFHLHFTPTSASWLNLVKRWFALLTEKQIRRGTHRSTAWVVCVDCRTSLCAARSGSMLALAFCRSAYLPATGFSNTVI